MYKLKGYYFHIIKVTVQCLNSHGSLLIPQFSLLELASTLNMAGRVTEGCLSLSSHTSWKEGLRIPAALFVVLLAAI